MFEDWGMAAEGQQGQGAVDEEVVEEAEFEE